MGSKEKDSYSEQKPSSKLSSMSNPHEKDSYSTKRILSSKSQIVGAITSSHDSRKDVAYDLSSS